MSEHDESTVQSRTVPYEDESEPVRMGWLEAALFVDKQKLADAPGTIAITGKDAAGNAVSETIHVGAKSDTMYSENRYSFLSAPAPDEATNELATGGVIENSGLAYNGPDSPEVVFTPPIGTKVNFTVNGWPANPTLLNPGGVPYAWNNNAAASTWINPAYSQPVTYHIPPPPAITEDRIRELVEIAVHKALYGESDGLVDTRHHRRVTMHEDNGDEWCGTLYKREKESDLDG